MTTKSEDRTTAPQAMGKMARRRSGRFAVSAFTMLELMIATVVLLLILGITGAIYKSANDAMQLNNASLYVNEDFSTLIRNIKPIMDGIYTDGYLVIYGRELTGNLVEKSPTGKVLFTPPSVRSDIISFFTTGKFQSLKDSTISTNSGWVFLGHAGKVNPTMYGTTPYDPNSPHVVNRWVFSRYVLLFAPGTTPETGAKRFAYDYRNRSIGELTKYFGNMSGLGKQDLRDNFYNAWINDSAFANRDFCIPPEINFSPDPNDPNNMDAIYTFPYTIPNCGHFEVQFAMPASAANANQPSDQPEMNGNQIVWRNAMDANPTGGANLFSNTNLDGKVNWGNVGGGEMVLFGPQDKYWPLFIKLIMRIYDDNLSVITDDPATQTTHGGTTMEYVFRLPPRQ